MGERLLVCGSRKWTRDGELFAILDRLNARRKIDVVIHGCARGADRMAGEWARSRGIPEERYPADWDRHGRAAGPLRNAQMLAEGKPTAAMAFVRGKLEDSRGTRDMVRRLEAANIPHGIVER